MIHHLIRAIFQHTGRQTVHHVTRQAVQHGAKNTLGQIAQATTIAGGIVTTAKGAMDIHDRLNKKD